MLGGTCSVQGSAVTDVNAERLESWGYGVSHYVRLPDGLESFPASWQSAKTTAVSAAEARAAWDDVAGQVRAQHLDLAVFFTEPTIIPGQAVVAGCEREGCSDGPSRDDRRC